MAVSLLGLGCGDSEPEFVGPEGGIVRGAGAILVVQPESLTDPVEISITPQTIADHEGPEGRRVVSEMFIVRPESTGLRGTASLIFPVDTTEARVDVWRLHVLTRRWMLVESALEIVDQHVAPQITRLGAYVATTTPPDAGMPDSGALDAGRDTGFDTSDADGADTESDAPDGSTDDADVVPDASTTCSRMCEEAAAGATIEGAACVCEGECCERCVCLSGRWQCGVDGEAECDADGGSPTTDAGTDVGVPDLGSDT